ncbi:diacylglycerol kinase family protein [Facklamia sp. 7083-14-GEN3]|uniref:diacylglycerol/lipid kinase family protein n=1 Tax=Facklamia sp. 7083-14-GEN3 TaxID=2973478 RepID=UPI00215BE5C7|nr:YegS/Rv2252/BmrU family lipid kinase [Facklamia sp. 7083-14-GEN3]MCR8969066.1 YegS/Rv2252/BmrU family lipid kinase [Facklamia sp. 7083-14-GEN3]
MNKQSRNIGKVLKKLEDLLPSYAINYDLLISENISQLDQLLFQLKKDIQPQDLLIVVGGDGSLNQFITSYIRNDFKNAIGYIPAGSGNDFARTHHIPTDTKKAIDYLLSIKNQQNLSIITANDNQQKHLAINSIGFGIDGLITHFVESKKEKEKMGSRSYLLGIFKGFVNQEKFSLRIKVDNQSYEFKKVQLAVIANNPYFGGGIKIAPHSSNKDKLLEVVIANDVSFKNLFSILAKLLINQSHLSHPKIHSYQSEEIYLEIESNQYAQKDGEVFQQDSYHICFSTLELPFWL